MDSEPCTCLQEPEEAFLPISSLATGQLSLWSGMPTAVESCGSGQPMAGSPACRCGRGMSDCLIHPNTPEAWIASMRASLAQICQSLEPELELAKAHARVCTERPSGWLAQYDRDGSFWRTSQTSIVPELELFTATWPRSVMSTGPYAYSLPMLERLTTGIGGGALQGVPTPTVSGNYNRKEASKRSGDGLATWAGKFPTPTASDHNSAGHPTSKQGSMNLRTFVQRCPTPSANDWKGSIKPGQRRGQLTDPAMGIIPAGGKLNPRWVEWLMGWPVGHTELKPSATGKSRSRPRRHSGCLSSFSEETTA